MATPNQRNDDLINEDIPGRNPDPITGTPGAHPIGTGVGAAAGLAVCPSAGRVKTTARKAATMNAMLAPNP